MNSFLNDIKGYMSGDSEVIETSSKYDNMELGVEAELIDDMCDMFGNTESGLYEELVGISLNASMGNESGEPDIDVLYSKVGMEAEIVEKGKRVAYRAKALVKSLIRVIIKFVKNYTNILFNRNLMLKKFGKLIKKYRERLQKTKVSDTSKEITVTKYSGLDAFIKELSDDASGDTLSNTTSKVKAATTITELKNAVAGFVVNMSEEVFNEATVKNPDKVEEISNKVKDKDILEKYQKQVEKQEFDDTDDVKVSTARATAMVDSAKLELVLKKDLKVHSKIRKLLDALEKQEAKIVKNADDDNIEEALKNKPLIEQYSLIIAQGQTGMTKLYKHAGKLLQGFITQMYKIESAC